MEPDVSASVHARTNLTPSFRRRQNGQRIKPWIKRLYMYFVGLNEILVSARYGQRIRVDIQKVRRMKLPGTKGNVLRNLMNPVISH